MNILVAVAWPYAAGPRHIGHLAGAYLPADIFARYHRLIGNEVLMVSGSDVHGTPITVMAHNEGVTPAEIASRYHSEFVQNWQDLNISFDCYTSTGTENHAEVVREMFASQLENGYVERRSSNQLYDPEAEQFLPDRYVEGQCPNCEYGEARGDQCDNCSKPLQAVELINPVSKISGTTPVVRETDHFYFCYSQFARRLKEWLDSRQGWRNHVVNMALGWLGEGIQDRAITRDIDWGVELPIDDLGPGKRFYVWYDAVCGYLSASKEWAADQGNPDAWRNWWTNNEAQTYYFIGKDNIPFHALFWPCQLMGAGDFNLPTDVPANQYITFNQGEKASASRGIGLTINEALERFEADALRYAIAASLPETADKDMSEREIGRLINEELVATWGNLVNRVWSMSFKSCDGRIPEQVKHAPEDRALLAKIDEAITQAAEYYEAVELRQALRKMMAAAHATNRYLSDTAPWKVLKEDPARGKAILHTALEAIAGVRVGLAPILPRSTTDLDVLFDPIERWGRPPLVSGREIPPPTPLFDKIDLSV